MNKLNFSSVSVEDIRPDIALIRMDCPGSSANVLNQTLFEDLDQAMANLMARNDLLGVILISSKPKIFVAGADLKQIVSNLDWPDKEIVKFCEKGRAVMARFSRCPFVSVAAIHGACVGGGLELALWCDYRIASDDRRTRLGLPEVGLGLVPGWAGTARLPRLAGIRNACDLITSGRLIDSESAEDMGFINEVVEKDALIESAVGMIQRTRTSEAFIHERRAIMEPVGDLEDLDDLVLEFGKKIVANEAIFPFAPTVVLEHLVRTANQDIRAAWDSESLAMAQVWGSPASRGLLNHFFLVDRNKKFPGLVDQSLTPAKYSSVGIVGAGLMGSSIAKECSKFGMSVRLLDADQAKARIAVDNLASPDVQVANDYGDLSEMDLILETVVETLPVKLEVLENIESNVPAETLIATNTSAIPIQKLAAGLKHPDRFCGIHFCHPELMALVEVACGPKTSEQTVANAVGWTRGIRKMPIAINDGPGFVVNRLLAAMIDESISQFVFGHSIESVDKSMREFGFQAGPFEIIDIIGVDTCMYAGRTIWESGLKCVSLVPVLPKLVKAGRLGRKSGEGFYRYDSFDGPPIVDSEVASILSEYQIPSNHNSNVSESDPLENQILAAIALEATRILEEEIVADFRDVDLAIIHGFTFPKHQGGILFWGDQFGWDHVQSLLYRMSDRDERFIPTKMIIELADRKTTFYANS
ncbi:MAG: 3-hydroxyacyl-CoA dehydrogenase NAD-binding domain-containing protein [Planctomycetota bacterium]